MLPSIVFEEPKKCDTHRKTSVLTYKTHIKVTVSTHDLWRIRGNIWFITIHLCTLCAGKSLPELLYLVTVNN